MDFSFDSDGGLAAGIQHNGDEIAARFTFKELQIDFYRIHAAILAQVYCIELS